MSSGRSGSGLDRLENLNISRIFNYTNSVMMFYSLRLNVVSMTTAPRIFYFALK